MKLPNAHLAVVDRDKIVGYLLNPTHRFGASKKRFFAEFGFQLADWETLARALRVRSTKRSQQTKRDRIRAPL